MGWALGTVQGAVGCQGSGVNAYVPEVFVEIYDDTSATNAGINCFTHQYFQAPSNASYDARYYGTIVDNVDGTNRTLYRYNVYYETPGSGNIQVLAYGDFNDQMTLETAGLEVKTTAPCDPGVSCNATPPTCPYASGPSSSNVHGQYIANTFAEQLQLYTSTWSNWTSSVVPTTIYTTHQRGVSGTPNATPGPYYLTPIATYTQFNTGGPHS